MKRIAVYALGGNALRSPGGDDEQAAAVLAGVMSDVVDLLEAGWSVVLTHGNGPQVGFMALRSELTRDQLHELPLDSIVADTQGSIGYMIQRALREELRRRGLPFLVSSLVTEVEVDPHDQAFEEPTKPIGHFYSEQEAQQIGPERGWRMVEDAHRGWRRVVPSPAPVRVLQLQQIARLTDWGSIVICCGGGGIPLVRKDDGSLVGVEGVIDKDRASALLGVRLGAQRLVISTAVDGVYKDFLTDHPELIREIKIGELNDLAEQGQFPPGSMGPKVKAADRFLRNGGEEVIICAPEDLEAACNYEKGTRILPD